MRIRGEIVVDGKSFEVKEFHRYPNVGESICVAPSNFVIVDQICHNFVTNRLQVICKTDKKAEPRLQQQRKPEKDSST